MNSSFHKRVLSLICAAGLSFSSLSALSQERIGTILASAVNLRKGASSSSQILCSLTYHTAVTILGSQGDFYKVRWENVTGYVASEYVQDNDPVGHIGLVNTDNVNLRSSAQQTDNIIGQLSRFDEVDILAEENAFYKISMGGRIGYVAKDFITVSTAFTTDRDQNTPSSSSVIGLSASVISETVNMREAASASSGLIQTLVKGTVVRITGVEGEFYKVSYNSKNGYIMSKYLSFTEGTSATAKVTETPAATTGKTNGNGIVTSDTVNMREAASTSSGIMFILTKGTVVKINGSEGDFYKVSYNGKNGFIVKKYLDFTDAAVSTAKPQAAATEAPAKMTGNGVVATDTVNMREAASTSSGIMFTLTKGTVVKINGSEGNFYKVSYNGKNGYIMKNYMEFTDAAVSTAKPQAAATEAPAKTTGNGVVTTDTVNMREAASTSSGLMFSLTKGTIVKINGNEGDFYKVSYNGKNGYIMKKYLSFTDAALSTVKPNATSTPAPAKTTGNGVVTTDTVNMREAASTSSGLITTLKKGTVVKINGIEGDFYKVSYNGKNGYIMKTFLEFTDAAVSTAKPAATATEPPVKTTGNGVVTADTVNMREAASTSSGLMFALTKDTVVKINGIEGEFYKVSYNGKNGYIMKKYLAFTDAAVSTAKPNATATTASVKTSGNGVVTAETVNMREAASTSSGIMFTLTKGTVIKINGVEGDFYKVSYSGKTGFVMKNYLQFTDAAVTSATVTAAPEARTSSVTGNVIVTADSLNVRKSASTSAEILMTLTKGTVVKVSATDGDFYKITYQGTTGYVAKRFVQQTSLAVTTARPTASPAPKATATPKASGSSSSTVNSWGKVSASTVNLREKASSSSDILTQIKSGEYVYIYNLADGFYKVKYDGKTGYVASTYVTVVSSTPAPTTKASATAAPSTSKYASISSISGLGDAPGYLSYGDSGEDVEKLQQALKIKGYFTDTVNGKFGSSTQSAIKEYQTKVGLTVTGKADYQTILKLFGKVSETTVADDPKMNGITSISQITVPNTSKKGDSGSKVIALQQALKLKGYFKTPIDGNFGTVTQNAVLAFQKAKGITQTGEADNNTIKTLFGKNAANYTFKTESLDWFAKGDNTIPKRAVFTVKDCLTGKTFRCKRWSGANHSDTEPLTKEDTAILKSIYGGSWSWNRRAVLVLYNGHVYAGSMNGMPHGTSTIDNDFDGHFCIHFTGSMTHGSKKVDPDHQNAIKRALKYTW